MASKNWNRPQMFKDELAEDVFLQAKKISELMNLGPMSEKHFTAAGIDTPAQFRKLGWQRTMKKLVDSNPKHRHSLYAYALIGALQNTMWSRISAKNKAEARLFCASLKKPVLNKKKK